MPRTARRVTPSKNRSDGPVRATEESGRQHHQIRVVPLTQLKPAPYNPRRISAEALNGLTASLKEFGVVQPIIWNERTGHVVGGHQRLQVLQARGDQEAQVVVVDLPPEKEKALNVTLNNQLIAGEFTGDLESILSEIEASMPAFYEDARLDELWANLDVTAGAAGGGGGGGGASAEEAHQTLAQRFGVPPFSVLDARQGYWQDRKRAWIALGIVSEIGRGENLLQLSAACNLQQKGKAYK